MSKAEFMSLMRLDKKDFQYREWVALAYAREWTHNRGSRPDAGFCEELESHYSKKERARIRKMLRMMLFANYCGNAVFKRAWKRGMQSCELPK